MTRLLFLDLMLAVQTLPRAACPKNIDSALSQIFNIVSVDLANHKHKVREKKSDIITYNLAKHLIRHRLRYQGMDCSRRGKQHHVRQ